MDDNNIISDPLDNNKMDLVDDFSATKGTPSNLSKGKGTDTYENISDSESEEANLDKFIHKSQQEEWRKLIDTVKFSADVPISTLKGKSKNEKIQNLINKIHGNTN